MLVWTCRVAARTAAAVTCPHTCVINKVNNSRHLPTTSIRIVTTIEIVSTTGTETEIAERQIQEIEAAAEEATEASAVAAAGTIEIVEKTEIVEIVGTADLEISPVLIQEIEEIIKMENLLKGMNGVVAAITTGTGTVTPTFNHATIAGRSRNVLRGVARAETVVAEDDGTTTEAAVVAGAKTAATSRPKTIGLSLYPGTNVLSKSSSVLGTPESTSANTKIYRWRRRETKCRVTLHLLRKYS